MIIIGDIHGCFKTFKKALDFYPKDETFILVGDLIDRGPDSIAVVDYVMNHSNKIKCVRGNHEQMAIDWWENSYFNDWLYNGGSKVFTQYKEGTGTDKFKEHIEFFKRLPFYLEFPEIKNKEGRYLLVSHSIAVSTDLESCVESNSIIWGRRFPKEDPSNGKWFNVFGHTPTPTLLPAHNVNYSDPKQALKETPPILTDWYANIDTACCYGGSLTCLEFPSLRIKQFDSEIE